MTKIYPKCLHKKELAYTAKGHILPCCWLDGEFDIYKQKQILPLLKEKLKVKNNKNIDDIVNSEEWINFFKELKTNPSDICKNFCSIPINKSINRAEEKDHKAGKIKICCVYFQGKYTPDYVDRLYNSLKRNSTIPFEFVCYSDNPNVKADTIIPLPKNSDIKLHWHKLAFFSPLFAYQNPEDEIIIIDIDQVILNNVDDMIGWPVADNELVSYNKWWNNTKLTLNGGWYKFKSGTFKYVWDEFIKNIEYYQLKYYNKGVVHHKYYGEQNYVEDMIRHNRGEITLMPREWVGKYTNNEKTNLQYNVKYSELFNTDYMILDEPNPKLKVIHFANPNSNIHSSKEEWIMRYWK